MNKKVMFTFLLVALSLTACNYSTPELEAKKVEAESEARINEANAIWEEARLSEEHTLQMEIEREKKVDAVNAARIAEYSKAYFSTAARLLGVFALAALAVSFSIGSVGVGVGTARKAWRYGGLIFPDKNMQFPYREYKVIGTNGRKRVYAIKIGSGEVLALDTAKPADEQIAKGMFATMLHALQINGAKSIAKSGGQVRDVSYIDPAQIEADSDTNIVGRFDKILDLTKEN